MVDSYEPDTSDVVLRQLREEIAKIREEQFVTANSTNNTTSGSGINSETGIPAPAIGVTSIIPAVIAVKKDTGVIDLLNFDGKNINKDFTIGETVTGQSSGATAIVGDIDTLTSTTGTLTLVPSSITGTFTDGENLNGSGAGGINIADADGTLFTQTGRGHINAGAGSIIADASDVTAPLEIHFIDGADQDGQTIYIRAQDGQTIRVRRALTNDATTGNFDLDESFDIVENALVFFQYQVASNASPTGGWVPLITGVSVGAGGSGVAVQFPILYPKENLGTLNGVIDLSLNQNDGHYKQITLDGDASITFSNLPPSINGFKFYLLTIQDGTGGHVYTDVPNTVLFETALLGQLQTAPNSQTLWQFSTADGGSNWHAQVIQSQGSTGSQTPWLTDINANTFNLFNLDVLRYADGTQLGADGIIGFGEWGSAVDNDSILKWSIPASTLGNSRGYEWQVDLAPVMKLNIDQFGNTKLDMLFNGTIDNTKGISFFHQVGTLSSITPGAVELLYDNGIISGGGGFHGFHVGGELNAQFEIREDVIRANRNLDMITNNIFDVDVVEWASTGGFLSGTNHAIRSIGGGSTGIELNVPNATNFRILVENIGLTDSDVEYEFDNQALRMNLNNIEEVTSIRHSQGALFADIFTELAIIGGRQGLAIPDSEPQPIIFKSQEKTGFDTYVTRDIFTVDAREFFGGGGMKMHTDLNLQTQNINNVDVLKFIPDGGVITNSEWAMAVQFDSTAFNFNIPSQKDYIFHTDGNPIAILDPTGLQLLSNADQLNASLNPSLGARELFLTGVHTGGDPSIDGQIRLIDNGGSIDVMVATGGTLVNLTTGAGSTSFIGFNADDDLRMNTFNITGLDVLRFQVDGGVIGFGEFGISADPSGNSLNFSTPATKGYGFNVNLDPVAFLDSTGLNLLANTNFSDPALIAREVILQTHSAGTGGQSDGQFRLVGGDVIVGSGTGLVNLTTLSAGGADNLGNHSATQDLDLNQFFLRDYTGFTSAQGHSMLLNVGSIGWDLDQTSHSFNWTAGGFVTSLMTLTNSNLNVHNKRITNVSDPTGNLDAVNLQTLNTGFVTTNTNQSTGLTGDKQWDGTHNFNAGLVIGSSPSDLVAFNSEVASSIIPQSNGLNLGSSSNRWDIFGFGLNLQLGVGINNISTNQNQSDDTSVMTSLAIQNAIIAGAGGGSFVTTNTNQLSGLTGNKVWDGDHNFNGTVIIGNSVSDSVAFNSLVLSSIEPQSSGLNLGSSSRRWDIFGFGLNLQLGVGINNISTSSTQNNNTSIMTSQAIQTAILAGGGGIGDKIEEGNSSVEIVDFGTGQIVFTIDGSNVGSWFGSNFIVNTPATFQTTVNFNGNVNIGNSSTDTVDFNADIGSHLLPNSTSGIYDLGNSSKQWGELWVTGTGNIDNLRLNSGSTVDEISNSLASFGSDQLMTANAIQNAIISFGGGGGPTLSGTNAWTGTNTWSSSGSRFLSNLRIDGDIDHNGSRIGFRGATPQTGSPITTISLASSNATIASRLNQVILTLRTMGIFI